jgi:hypothetical protein
MAADEDFPKRRCCDNSSHRKPKSFKIAVGFALTASALNKRYRRLVERD